MIPWVPLDTDAAWRRVSALASRGLEARGAISACQDTGDSQREDAKVSALERDNR